MSCHSFRSGHSFHSFTRLFIHSIPFYVISFHVRSKTAKINLMFSTTLFVPASNLPCVIVHLEIGQLQGAHSELLWKKALLHRLSGLGLCWHLTQPTNEQLQGSLSQLLRIEAFVPCHRALVFVGTRINQQTNNFKVPIPSCNA